MADGCASYFIFARFGAADLFDKNPVLKLCGASCGADNNRARHCHNIALFADKMGAADVKRNNLAALRRNLSRADLSDLGVISVFRSADFGAGRRVFFCAEEA